MERKDPDPSAWLVMKETRNGERYMDRQVEIFFFCGKTGRDLEVHTDANLWAVSSSMAISSGSSSSTSVITGAIN
jgi:hypothetical protein